MEDGLTEWNTQPEIDPGIYSSLIKQAHTHTQKKEKESEREVFHRMVEKID